jgi:anti-anti-sigma factor
MLLLLPVGFCPGWKGGILEDRFAEAAASLFAVETVPCQLPGVAVLKLSGDLDMAIRAEFRSALAALAACRIAVLDVAAVSYADSTAISELIRFRKALLAAGGTEVRFVGPGSSFERILQLTDLTKIFPVFATLDEALANAEM